MIINTSHGNIEVAGDIKEFKTSIDPKNLEFVTTLLSSNLYSDPEQSFIREIVSNAWDSHVEAGTTNVPVIIEFKKSSYSTDITIRDHGTGLSPERFREIFCNIGSSTKRESNDFIGGFGLGRFSSLACSNTVYITSYYEGTAYYYLMVKSGNSITTNLLMEKPTEERNGVEVTIKGLASDAPYVTALNSIIFFPNIYVQGVYSGFNTTKIKRFNNFAASSICVDMKLLLDNVLYPLNISLLSLPIELSNFIKTIRYTGIVIKFNIGELNVTPNRENIIYNSEAINLITNRIKDAKDEIDTLARNKVNKDYEDILDYYNAIINSVTYDPINDKIYTKYTLEARSGYHIESLENYNITFKGQNLKNQKEFLRQVMCLKLPNLKSVIVNTRIYSNKFPLSAEDLILIKNPRIITLEKKIRLLEAIKGYLRENYDNHAIMTKIDYAEFESYVKEECTRVYYYNTMPQGSDFIIKSVYDSLVKRSKEFDPDTNECYLEYKNTIFANGNNSKYKEEQSYNLYVWINRGIRQMRNFTHFPALLDFIKTLKKGVVLANMKVDEEMLSEVALLRGYMFIQAKNSTVERIQQAKLKCIIKTEWLFEKDPLIAKVKAVLKYFPYYVDSNTLNNMCEDLTKKERDEYKEILTLKYKYGGNRFYEALVNTSKAECDPYTCHVCGKLKEHLDKYSAIKNLTLETYPNDVISMAIIKTKSYRISSKAYQRIRNNKLLKILCGKCLE